MSVTEKLMAPGQFNLTLDKSITPNTIINQLDAWGQIVIVPADINVQEYSDATLLSSASYVGIVYSLELGEEDSVNVFGQGLAAYLGDSDTRGMPISETGGNAGVRSYISSTLTNVLDHTGTPKGLLRDEAGNQGAIRKGTITEPSGTYTGKHYTESAMKAIKYVCQDLGVEFKISTSGYLDAGPVGTIFSGHSSDPTSIIVRDASGKDPNIDGVATTSLLAQYDASEFVSQVELIASKYGAEANIGNATASSIPYKDIFGSDLKRVQYISDPQTQGTSKATRASAYLNELNTIKKTLNVSLEEYDISGDFVVGDKIFIYDPDIGFVDTNADKTLDGRSELFEVVYQGQVLNPTKIRILGVTWPIKLGYGVFYRDKDGNYTELTDYCVWEDGDVQLEIGDVAPTIGESLGFSGYTVDQTGSPDKSIPGQPTDSNGNVGLNTISGSYSDGNGISKSFIKVTWNQPLNSDGSSITDGAYYRLRYRVVQDTDGNNIIDSSDTQVSEYIYSTVDFDTREFIIYDLSPNTYYEIGVQAIDISGFDSAFSTVSSIQTSSDAGAPNKPDGFATIASNPLRVQFIHNLGQAKNDAGNAVSPVVDFTLAKDLDHLNIYASTTQGFSLNYNSTTNKVTNSGFKIGELKATSSHIQNGIAAVGYIDLDNASTHYFRLTAVDSSGNESEPSDEQTGSAELINTSHIANLAVTNAVIANAAITDAKVADLSAGKITAGTISGQTIILNASGDTGSDSDIRSSNYATGTAGWRINSDGVAEFQNATIRGSLNASDITAGTLSSDRLDTNFIAVGGAATDVNDGSTTIDGGNITTNSITTNQLNFTPLQDGDAITDGTIAGITINSTEIQSTGFNSSSGFQISSNGDAIFRDVTIRGTLEGTTLTDNLTLNGGTIRTSSSGSRVEIVEDTSVGMINFYDSSSELTMSMQASTDEFQMVGGLDDNVVLSTIPGKELQFSAGTLRLNATGNGTGGPINLGTPGTNNITQVDVKIGIATNNGNYDYGTSGQVLQSNSTGVSWETVAGHNHTGITFPNSGTVLSTNTHNHSTDFSNFLTSTDLTNHSNSNNAHNAYLQNTDHNENNNAHSNFISNADLSDYITNNNSNFLSAVGHTAMAAGNAGVAHGLTLGDVLTNSNHSHGNTHNHSGTVLTTSGADNLYATPHNHPYGTGNGNGNGNGNSNLTNANVDTSHGPHGNGNHNHSGTVLTTAGSGNLYSAPHNSHSHNHSSYVTNTTYNNHLNNLHFSDSRLKTNIVDTSFGLSYINTLRPVDYEYTSDTLDTYFSDENAPFLRDMYAGVKHGFIAQEVRTSTFDNHASNTAFGGLGYKAESEQDNFEDIQTVDLEQFIGPVIKSIQELSAKIELLTARVEELEGE
jgi:hypothetical protein|tara:strand:- start:8615 stop:12745 length:4131 start_codon:yes stop_codon:yes gene_type:complete